MLQYYSHQIHLSSVDLNHLNMHFHRNALALTPLKSKDECTCIFFINSVNNSIVDLSSFNINSDLAMNSGTVTLKIEPFRFFYNKMSYNIHIKQAHDVLSNKEIHYKNFIMQNRNTFTLFSPDTLLARTSVKIYRYRVHGLL